MEDAVKKASDGSTDLSGAVLTYCDFFLRSEEVRTLKEKEELLHKDPELLALAGDKKKLEDELSFSVLQKKGDAQELLERYNELLRKINSLPSVREYDAAFQAVKAVKVQIEKGILRKL